MEMETFNFQDINQVKALLPYRKPDANKGDLGRVLCVCGSLGMAGAAYLCAKAAYRSGAGLVEIFTHESNREILQTLIPEAIITPWNDQYSRDTLLSSLERADVVVAGCGLGTTRESRAIISDLVRLSCEMNIPTVLDADALNIISRSPALLKYAKSSVITPHIKEMSRLTGISVEDILSNPEKTALDFAKKHSLTCILKSHKTAVADGSDRVYVNTTGNSGMATGGSGDVLAGIIAGIFAQKRNDTQKNALNDAAFCVYLHGLCGDIAAEELTEYSLMASDMIDALPRAIGKLV